MDIETPSSVAASGSSGANSEDKASSAAGGGSGSVDDEKIAEANGKKRISPKLLSVADEADLSAKRKSADPSGIVFSVGTEKNTTDAASRTSASTDTDQPVKRARITPIPADGPVEGKLE